MNFSKTSTKILLLLILALGLTLRIVNLTVGFPMLYLSNDEAVYHLSALNMIANRTPFSLGNYGPLGSYIQIPFLGFSYLALLISGKIHSISSMELLLVSQEGYFMFIPRILSALFGTLTILSIYRLSLVLFKNKYVALWSAFFTAVSFNLVHISHFARSLSPALFFASLAVLFAIYGINNPKREFRNRLLSFIFAGIAFGFHQIFGIIVIFPIVVAVKTHSTRNLRSFAVPLLAWILLILIFNFLSLGDKIFEIFRSKNTLGLELIRTPSFWVGKDIRTIVLTLFVNIKMFRYLVLAEGLILFFALYGFVKEKIDSRIKYSFSALFLTCILFSIFIFPPVLRYFLPSIVFLPLFAGIGAYCLLNRKNIVLIILVILLASFNSSYWNWLVTRDSTFFQMRKWLDENISVSTPIAATFYRTVGYVPSRSASGPIRKFRPGYYLRAANILGDNNYPYNVREILYIEAFNKGSKADNLKAAMPAFPAKYIIDAYYQDSERLLYMINNLELVVHFSPTGEKIYAERIPEAFADVANNFPFFVLDRTGPYFDILKLTD